MEERKEDRLLFLEGLEMLEKGDRRGGNRISGKDQKE